jgi:HK97 family phage prohead protease
MFEEQIALVARSHGLHVREVREAKREADFVASTDAIDAYDEIVEQVWRLDRFHSNPVVLYAHQSRELPIGVATFCDVRDGNLICTIRFVTEDKNPKAEQVWKMVRDRELRAVSVGFVPHSYRWEKKDDREVLILSDNELHEISVVPIPANPEALAKMKAKAMADAAKDVATKQAAVAAETDSENMKTIEQLMAEVAERDAALADLKRKLADSEKGSGEARTTLSALESQNKTLAAERDAAVDRAKKVEDALIEAEVSALVGSKITPAEKDDFVALRKSNPELYAKFVAQRTDKNLTTNVISPKQAPVVAAGDAGEPDVFSEAAKSA